MITLTDEQAKKLAQFHGFTFQDDGFLWKDKQSTSLDDWKVQPQTPSEFQIEYGMKFTSDLQRDIERQLTNILDGNGDVKLYYGQLDAKQFAEENDGDDIAEPFYLDINCDSYFFESAEARNAELKFLEFVIREFALINGITVDEILIK